MTSVQINKVIKLGDRSANTILDIFERIESHRSFPPPMGAFRSDSEILETQAEIINYIYEELEPLVKIIKEIKDEIDS